VRNFLASLLLSQGVPMISGGDEVGRTQRGNNNAYCHDNEISWYDWTLDEGRTTLLNFTAALIALRKAHPTFAAASSTPKPRCAKPKSTILNGTTPMARR
jgi:isoamylase